MYSPEMQAQIAIWRQKALDGELTADELKLSTAALRADRHAALDASDASKRKKAKALILSAEDIEKELGI